MVRALLINALHALRSIQRLAAKCALPLIAFTLKKRLNGSEKSFAPYPRLSSKRIREIAHQPNIGLAHRHSGNLLLTFPLIAMFSFTSASETNAENKKHSTNSKQSTMEAPMEIQSAQGRVLINSKEIISQAAAIEEGLVEALGPTSVATINYLDGDKLTLQNGSAQMHFGISDSFTSNLGATPASSKNLNSRLIELKQGTLNIKMRPKAEMSKVSYRLKLASSYELYFKDADLSTSFDGKNGELKVIRGEVSASKLATNGTFSDRTQVMAGEAIKLIP